MSEFILLLAIWSCIPAALVLLAMLFYLRAVRSRKHYQCPHCGERVRVELMDASHCNHCGAPLQRSETP